MQLAPSRRRSLVNFARKCYSNSLWDCPTDQSKSPNDVLDCHSRFTNLVIDDYNGNEPVNNFHNLDETHNLENKSYGKIILLLLSRGVDVAAKDHNGDTAQQLAVKLGRQEIAEFLDESSREI